MFPTGFRVKNKQGNLRENMENVKKISAGEDKDIIFSQSVKAGKRIYYIDVKNNRNNDKFLTITESKKVVSGEGENAQVSFEKHKIWIYREDLRKFLSSLEQAVKFIEDNENGESATSEVGTNEAGPAGDDSSLGLIDINFD